MNAADWIAIYAAIVATGALFLEIRRWFESGPQIHVRATPNMMVLGGSSPEEERDLLMVHAYNRGDQPTTITNMVIFEYSSRWSRWRGRPKSTFLIPHPQLTGRPPIIPAELRPGGQWSGMARTRSEITGDLQSGCFWAGVVTTDRDRPYLARIPKRKKAGSDTTTGPDEI